MVDVAGSFVRVASAITVTQAEHQQQLAAVFRMIMNSPFNYHHGTYEYFTLHGFLPFHFSAKSFIKTITACVCKVTPSPSTFWELVSPFSICFAASSVNRASDRFPPTAWTRERSVALLSLSLPDGPGWTECASSTSILEPTWVQETLRSVGPIPRPNSERWWQNGDRNRNCGFYLPMNLSNQSGMRAPMRAPIRAPMVTTN